MSVARGGGSRVVSLAGSEVVEGRVLSVYLVVMRVCVLVVSLAC